LVNALARGISAWAVRFGKDTDLSNNQTTWWKVMNKLFVIFSILALSVSAPALAGWGNGTPPHEQPQADPKPNSDSDFGAPGGHGGGGFGTSDVGHTSPNGHIDPSGTNGNQASPTGAAHSGNVDRGNAGGPGGGECNECGGGGGGAE